MRELLVEGGGFTKRLGISLTVATIAGATLLSSRDGHAQGGLGLEVAAKGALGTNPVGDAYPDPLHFGIGGRAGVTLGGLYAGGSVVYYLGSSQADTVDGRAGQLSTRSLAYGAEAGYGFQLWGLLTVRPQLGLGSDKITVKGTGAAAATIFGGSGSETTGYLYLEPAVLGLVPIGSWFVGADVGALLLPSGPYKRSPCDKASCTSFDAALTTHIQFGFAF
jgi:hypothetical protein